MYKIDETVADPVNSSFWRSNFYIIPGRPPGNDYVPPLLPKSGKSMQLFELKKKINLNDLFMTLKKSLQFFVIKFSFLSQNSTRESQILAIITTMMCVS